MILSSISPPRAGRPGAQSDSRWTPVHHALPRAAGRANRRRSRARLAQRPVQTHRQVTSQGHLGHVSASPENQTLILAPQFGIKLRRAVTSSHKKQTKLFIPLFADVAQRLSTAAGILARVQPQITDQLAAVRKTLDRTYGQHEGQSGHRPHALVLHQLDRLRTALGLRLHRLIELGDPRPQTVQQLQQLLPPLARPGAQAQPFELRSAPRAPQLLLPAHALAHGQEVQLVPHRGLHPHRLVSVLQQLPHVALLRRRHPDAREAFRQQQIQQVLGVPRVGLLPPHGSGPNLGRVSDPQLVAQFRHQALEPLRVARRLHPDQRWLRQTGIKRPRFSVLMFQPARYPLAGVGLYHGDNLVARMQITSDNRHVRLLSRQPWSWTTNQVYRSKGADAVMESDLALEVCGKKTRRPEKSRSALPKNCGRATHYGRLILRSVAQGNSDRGLECEIDFGFRRYLHLLAFGNGLGAGSGRSAYSRADRSAFASPRDGADERAQARATPHGFPRPLSAP